MNKAFLREPEDTGERHCPRCGSLGQSVARSTLDAQLTSSAAARLSAPAYFCPYALCDVGYFDLYERVAEASEFRQPVYPKDPDAPLCGCFGLTAADIEADIREGVVTRTRAIVERARTSEAQCALRAASGRSCVAEVQRYYLKCRGQQPLGER